MKASSESGLCAMEISRSWGAMELDGIDETELDMASTVYLLGRRIWRVSSRQKATSASSKTRTLRQSGCNCGRSFEDLSGKKRKDSRRHDGHHRLMREQQK